VILKIAEILKILKTASFQSLKCLKHLKLCFKYTENYKFSIFKNHQIFK